MFLLHQLRSLLGRWRRRLRRRQPLASDQMLAGIAARTSDSMVLTDERRRIVWVNAAFEQRMGWTLEEVRGRSPGAVLQIPETDPLTIARMRECLNAGRAFDGEVLNATRHGERCWFHVRLEPLFDDHGRLQGFAGLQTDISERVWSEMALRAQKNLYEAAARVNGTGAWELDMRSGCLQLTDGACRLLGCDPDQPPAMTDILRCFSLDGLDAIDAQFEQGLDLGKGWELQLLLRDFQGRERWVRLHASCEYDDHGPHRLLGSVQDVSRDVVLQDSSRRTAALLRDAIDSIEEAFIIFDEDDRVAWCNERYRELYSLSADLLVPGTRFEDLIREGARRGQYPAAVGREDEWVRQRLAQHQAGNRTVVQKLDTGRVLRFVERVTPSGHRVGFRVDITELVRATEAAEQADRSKGEFIATISHELRTPLQSILGFSDLGMHFAAAQPPFDQMFKDIHDGGQRMLRLVNGLLDVSKLDSGSAQLKPRPADLARVAADVARELEGLAAQRGVRFQLPAAGLQLPVKADVFRLSQVVRNVMANAIRFAPPGTAIEVDGQDLHEDGVRLTVRDHGPGIPPGEQEAVFEAFVQSSRTQDGSGGTGLGLTIARKIMQAHGGRIGATEPRGGGSGACLLLWLPPDPDRLLAEAAPAHGAPGPAGAPPPPKTATRSLRDIRAAQRRKEAQADA